MGSPVVQVYPGGVLVACQWIEVSGLMLAHCWIQGFAYGSLLWGLMSAHSWIPRDSVPFGAVT